MATNIEKGKQILWDMKKAKADAYSKVSEERPLTDMEFRDYQKIMQELYTFEK